MIYDMTNTGCMRPIRRIIPSSSQWEAQNDRETHRFKVIQGSSTPFKVIQGKKLFAIKPISAMEPDFGFRPPSKIEKSDPIRPNQTKERLERRAPSRRVAKISHSGPNRCPALQFCRSLTKELCPRTPAKPRKYKKSDPIRPNQTMRRRPASRSADLPI